MESKRLYYPVLEVDILRSRKYPQRRPLTCLNSNLLFHFIFLMQ